MQAKYLQIEFLLHEVISLLIPLLTIVPLHKHRHVLQRDDNRKGQVPAGAHRPEHVEHIKAVRHSDSAVLFAMF